MKVIFLDIDGVLIPEFNHENINQIWRQSCINSLLFIVNKTNARIVISSGWRNNIAELKTAWLESGLDWNLIAGVTPSKVGKERSDNILQWLEWNPVDNWITIDDEDFNLVKVVELGKLVKTEIGTGLNKEIALRAINILNNGKSDEY